MNAKPVKEKKIEQKQSISFNLDNLIPKISELVDEFKTMNILLRIIVVAMFLMVLSKCVKIG